ncbi:MAG: dihydrolipoyl dehydrogenase [Candidatus Marinimicrobia bacterium]|nr:dihydrolipoyl dehydrogenase [Candidatus Neomarinimicrobiota bacterium]
MKKFDVIIIGGGPGGYVAGIRASQLKLNVAIIEDKHLGGICLNWGCIPTKALLKNAEVLHTIKNAKKFGIEIEDFSINWKKVIKRSRDISRRLSKGIEFLLKKNKISHINGRGILKSKTEIEVLLSDGKKEIFTAKNIIIATGARSKYFSGMEPNGKRIITSKEAMVLDEQPKSLIVIGAGAIGIEFAHFYNSYGTEVTIIEALPQILPTEDIEVADELSKIFKKRGMKILTETFVENVTDKGKSVEVKLKSGEVIIADYTLVAVGVQSNIENIGLEKLGIKTDKGSISVNNLLQTNIQNIYAIGDVAGPPMLAHKASAEGIIAIEHLAGENPAPMEYTNISGCIYSHPEVASVGLTENQAVDLGYKIKVGKFPFRALGKSMAIGETEGFIKVIYDEKFGEMLGCHIIGAEATNLISEAAIARKLETTWHEVLQTIHPHPTLSEGIMEATADAFNEAIHI